MSIETIGAALFPERIEIVGRDDCFLESVKLDDAEDTFAMLQANPSIARYQYWIHSTTSEQIRQSVQDRLLSMALGQSAQYRLRADDEPHFGGMVGTLTAYDYDPVAHEAKIGYYQSESSRGKGRVHDAVGALIGLLKEQWDLRFVSFDIEDGNLPSQRVAEKLGAVRTNEFKDYVSSDGMIANRTWRLSV